MSKRGQSRYDLSCEAVTLLRPYEKAGRSAEIIDELVPLVMAATEGTARVNPAAIKAIADKLGLRLKEETAT